MDNKLQVQMEHGHSGGGGPVHDRPGERAAAACEGAGKASVGETEVRDEGAAKRVLSCASTYGESRFDRRYMYSL